MKKFKELKPESIEDTLTDKLRKKIISNLEDANFSPFKGLDTELKVIDSSKSLGYYASYEIFNESRDVHWQKDPTSESQGTYSPTTDMSNVDKWSYSIVPRNQFNTHLVSHDVQDSKHVKTCHSCNGTREINCSTCKGNGNCGSCQGKGENACLCGNGNCNYCAGKGERICTLCDGKGVFGSSTCSRCKGALRIKCNSCDGNGKHKECNGTGKIKCYRCNGSGACTGCNGKGKVTCKTCNGRGNLLHYLRVKAKYVNSLESKQLLANIDSFNAIKIDEIAVDTEVIKEITEKEFNKNGIGKAADIEDINDYLMTRKSGYSESHILQERIKIIRVPVVTVNYTLNDKVYTSYFIGEKKQHFYKNSPLKDYNEAVDSQIEALIKETNLPDAITLLDEQVSRYESLADPENVKRCSDLISDLKIGIQKDQMKGGFFAQIVFSLLDFLAIYTLVSTCGLYNQSNSIFFVLALPLLFVRIGFYFKHLVPQKLFSEIDHEELNKYLNGDSNYSYYMFDNPALKILRVIGTIGIIGFVAFTIDGKYDLITQEISIAYIIYALLFGITLLTTMMLDIGVNRKIKKVLKIKTYKLRMLRTLSINTTIYAIIGIIVLLIAGIFVSDKPNADLSAVGSVADGLTNISYYLYSLLILGVLSYLISGGQTKHLKRLKVNENHKAGFLNIISKNKKKLKLAAILLCVLFAVIIAYHYGMKFYVQQQIENEREEKKIEYYAAIKDGDAALEEGNMKSADNYYSLAENINIEYRLDDNWSANKKSLRLDSLVELERIAQEEAKILAEEQKRLEARMLELTKALALDTLSDSLTNNMYGAIGDYPIKLQLNLIRVYTDDSIKTFDYEVNGNYDYYSDSKIEFTGDYSTQTNLMQIKVPWDDGPETFNGSFYNDSIYIGDWSKIRKEGTTNLKFQAYSEINEEE